MKKIFVFIFLIVVTSANAIDYDMGFLHPNLGKDNKYEISVKEKNIFNNFINLEDEFKVKYKFNENNKNNILKLTYNLYEQENKFGIEYTHYKFYVNENVKKIDKFLLLSHIETYKGELYKNKVKLNLKKSKMDKKDDVVLTFKIENTLAIKNSELILEPSVDLSKIDNAIYKLSFEYNQKIGKNIFYNGKINSQFSKNKEVINIGNRISTFDEDRLRFYEDFLTKNGESFVYNDIGVNIRNLKMFLILDYNVVEKSKYLGSGLTYKYNSMNFKSSYVREFVDSSKKNNKNRDFMYFSFNFMY